MRWFLAQKVVSNFFYVALVCLLQPRCRFLINIARGSAKVQCHVLLSIGRWLSARFTHAACEKAEKWINKVERKINKIRCRKHSLPVAFLSCVCRGTKLAARLSTLVTSVPSTGRSNREDQVQGHAERRRRMCTFLTIFLGFCLLHYLVCYNVKHHAIVVTLAVRSLPSSSVACWSFKVFVARLFHTHPPRPSQNGKEERKLWSCQPCRFCFVLL